MSITDEQIDAIWHGIADKEVVTTYNFARAIAAHVEQQPRAAVPDSVRDEYALTVAQRLWVLPAMPKAQLIATLQCAIRDAMDWAAPPPPAVPAGCGRNAVALICDDNGDPLRGQRYENGEWSLRNWHAMRDDNAEAAGAVPAGGVVLDTEYLAAMPCETAGVEDLEPGCCRTCRARALLSAQQQPEHTGVGSWCAPGPADQQVRRWLLRFEDAEVREAIYDNEPEARTAFAKAEGRGWNCHLFAHAPRAVQPDPVLSGPLHVIGDGQMPDKLRERIRKGQEVDK